MSQGREVVSKSWKYQKTDSPLKPPDSNISLQKLKTSETRQNSNLQKYNKICIVQVSKCVI